MAVALNLLENYLYAVGYLLINPLLYAFLFFIYWQYRKQMIWERQLFSVRLHSPLVQTLRGLGMGIVGGLFVSLLAAVLGIYVQVTDMWIAWTLALILALFRVRFLCLAYGTAIFTALHGVALLVPFVDTVPGVGMVWRWFANANPAPLLALVGLLHLMEAWFIRTNRGADASPLFIEGKRGRIIGAYQLQAFWLAPVIVLSPVAGSGLDIPAFYPGWPLFSPEMASASLGLLLLPAVTGFSALTKIHTPQAKAKSISKHLVWYSLLLVGLSYAAVLYSPVVYVAAFFAFFGHEFIGWLSNRQEAKGQPYYVPHSRGLKVMAVLPDTPADNMGIQIGEVIVKVNGSLIQRKEDLYTALQINPAFCKMEVLTRQNEIKFVQSAIYAGMHHQLGIIVVPDERTKEFVSMRVVDKISKKAIAQQKKEQGLGA
ncbi:PDZ domain-containing protein [Brevibacillus daliensis]|uniref:PDZ domain-containing protein n=1 Tax=Brevibacillus daliensis TaxID=2892995 RepID=UPI001E4AAF9F|nr:PDZ domain-containing protein [Brevibacillus daliensis]